MKKTILLFTCLLWLGINMGFAQAKKPTIMVVPSDLWMNQNGYMKEYDNQGTKTKIPDYKRALQENSDLLPVISKINSLMSDRGFPLKNLESCLKTLENESAEDNVLTSKASGSSVAESPIEKLKKVAKADIIMQITWTVVTTGPKKSISFTLQGLDAYTDKQVAGDEGVGAPSFSADLPTMLGEAVLSRIDNFNTRLQAHFDDMFTNGREVTIRIKKWTNWEKDLEAEFDGKELKDILDDWMKTHTVKGRYSQTDASENAMLFEQVRIPLYDAQNKALDANGFLKQLRDFLKAPPYNITSKLMTRGLGQASLVLGEK